MAWARLLPSGKYQGLYRDSLGERQSAGTFTQRAQAIRAAGKIESEQREPGAVDVNGGKITWSAWFELWMESHSVVYATEDCYRSTAANHIAPVWGDVKLVDIKPMRVQRWVKEMIQPPKTSREKPKSPWTVRNALMLMKTTLNAAVESNRLGANPAKSVPYPDLPQGLERYLTPEEVERITFYMDGIGAVIVWTGVQTGLRFGELAGLHWDRVNLDRGMVDVVRQFNQKTRMIEVLKDKQRRTVPLPPDLVSMLRQYREHAARGRGTTCGLVHNDGSRCESDLLFRGARGAPLKSNDWGKTIWKRALQLGGIEGRVRPHDMRHTYASWLIQEGVPLPELARVMGHSDWEVTRQYAHLSDAGFEVVRDAVSRHRGGSPEPEPQSDLEERLRELEERLSVLSRHASGRASDHPQTPANGGNSLNRERAS